MKIKQIKYGSLLLDVNLDLTKNLYQTFDVKNSICEKENMFINQCKNEWEYGFRTLKSLNIVPELYRDLDIFISSKKKNVICCSGYYPFICYDSIDVCDRIYELWNNEDSSLIQTIDNIIFALDVWNNVPAFTFMIELKYPTLI